MVRLPIKIIVLGILMVSLFLTPASLAQTRPAFVDLSRFQTDIRNQGGRTTCITFAAIAGFEAAYKGAGYGNLDLRSYPRISSRFAA